jgi:hypothetical protein
VQGEQSMSVFRIVYRQHDHDHPSSEDVDAVEFVQKEPWIVFLDPAGTCRTVRSRDVERIERLQLTPPASEEPASIPSYPPIPASSSQREL